MMKKRLYGKSKAVFIVVFVFFTVYAVYLLYPFAFAFNASLKENGRAFLSNTVSFAWPMYFSNYVKAFRELETADNSFLRMTFNSVWYAAGTTFLSMLSSVVTAYALCKYKFPGRNFLYSMILVIMMLPIYGALPARYRLLSQLGWLNSPLYVLSAANGFDFAFLVVFAFFKGVPWSYAEAAFIDGAGHFKVFFRIMLPMALPSITAITITTFIGAWNAYEAPLLYLPEMPTLAAGLYAYQIKTSFFANQPVYFAGVTLTLIPIVGIFLAFQNTIMTKVYTGGLKG